MSWAFTETETLQCLHLAKELADKDMSQEQIASALKSQADRRGWPKPTHKWVWHIKVAARVLARKQGSLA